MRSPWLVGAIVYLAALAWGALCFQEDSMAAAARPVTATTFPDVANLPAIKGLPDPLVMSNGTRVTTPAQWRKRREELKALFEHYVYGRMPPAPGNVEDEELSAAPILEGGATHRIVHLRFGPEKKLSIRLSLIVPKGASAKDRKPVVLYLYRGDTLPPDGLWPDYDLIVQRGYVAACMANADCDPDNADRTNGYHPYYPDYDWATLACWAWGMQRCVDWLVAQDYVAADKIAVSGHSRRGKAALLAAAFDERIALAAPSGSGCGGVALSRAAEQTPGAETVREITKRFPYWFSPRFAEFSGCVDRLPVDQHLLIALVAPRAVINNDGLADQWANPSGEQAAMLAALPVYRLLGAGGLGDKVGLRFRQGGHDITREDWSAILDFCDKVLLGKKVERRFDVPALPAR